jgi:hypothetical protein
LIAKLFKTENAINELNPDISVKKKKKNSSSSHYFFFLKLCMPASMAETSFWGHLSLTIQKKEKKEV